MFYTAFSQAMLVIIEAAKHVYVLLKHREKKEVAFCIAIE